MKRSAIYAFFILYVLKSQAQDYRITFNAQGASTLIDSVLVDNLTQGTSLTISGEDELYLRSIVSDIKSADYEENHQICLYPNPMAQHCRVEFEATIQNDYVVELYTVSGQLVAQTHAFLSQGRHAYLINNLGYGLYTVRIKSPEAVYTGKISSRHQGNGMAQIVYLGISGRTSPEESYKSTGYLSQMQYNQGDRIKFTAFRGNYQTILTDIPSGDKTVTFKFAGCKDGDNNTYGSVQIGTQLWMAENLKTTSYADGTKIPLVTNDTIWRYLTTPAYCWYNNDSALYAKHYGALYDWFAFSEGKLCPAGWHVPSVEEWTSLVTYLTDNGYGFEEGGEYYSKSLAATSGWTVYEVPGTVGNDQSSNNNTGFSALPAGYRNYDGTFKEVGMSANWWSFTGMEPDCFAFYWYLGFNSLEIYNYKIEREHGYSVRCLKD